MREFCNCGVPCPCTFAQPPTEGECDGVIGWRVRSGNYGDVTLDGLNIAGVARFVGNIWEPETKAEGGFSIDERADDAQRQALATIFGGQAGGWPGLFAENFERVLGH
jgi:hypothetical protein